MVENTIVYLLGPPGVGKLTVGRIVVDRLKLILVDNHYWLNPIFKLIEQDGVTPLPKRVWPLVRQVRTAALETIATLSPRDWSFLFTHATTNSPEDRAICAQITSVAKRRGARMLAVRLACEPDELARRVIAPGRRGAMKETDPRAAQENASRSVFDPKWPNTLTLDTTGVSAEATAERIIGAIENLRPGIAQTRLLKNNKRGPP